MKKAQKLKLLIAAKECTAKALRASGLVVEARKAEAAAYWMQADVDKMEKGE